MFSTEIISMGGNSIKQTSKSKKILQQKNQFTTTDHFQQVKESHLTSKTHMIYKQKKPSSKKLRDKQNHTQNREEIKLKENFLPKDKLANIFFFNPYKIPKLQEGSSQITQKVYSSLVVDLQYSVCNPLRTTCSGKLKTMIMRRVMDEIVSQKYPTQTDSRRDSLNKRMTYKDKQRYLRANLPIPPSRFKDSDIANLFKLESIRKFYHQFVKGSMKEIFLKENAIRIEDFQHFLDDIFSNSEISDEEKLHIIQKSKKPFSLNEMRDLILFAEQIEEVYIKKVYGSQ